MGDGKFEKKSESENEIREREIRKFVKISGR
jgi:hypothetical protein